MKLWDKGTEPEAIIEAFTVGKDQELDLFLAPYDILGTIAHCTMLVEIGLIEEDEFKLLKPELTKIFNQTQKGEFVIEEGVEDVHSQVELMLTKELGDIGKKVHSGRSRNDQVLVDLKLYFLNEIHEISKKIKTLFESLQTQSEKYKDVLLPGYTHFQVAMPSSFGLWFGAYAESLIDDLIFLQAAWKVSNQNPLGSAAGYGNSFPLNRSRTTELLGFDTLSFNVINAQMGRGKTEKLLSYAIASIASTLNKLSSDICLYMSQNFGFISFPDELTTGSSIMPHKKNPDVFEIMRARSNRLQNVPVSIGMIITNLPSGYHRDLQLTKEILLPAIEEIKSCLHVSSYMLERIIINRNILDNTIYDYLFSVERVNELVLKGVPFRDAYKQVGLEINSGKFKPEKKVNHMHEGSIGNLCTNEIKEKFENVIDGFGFDKLNSSWEKLIQE